MPKIILLKKDNNEKAFKTFINVKIIKPTNKIRVILLKIFEKIKVSSRNAFIAYVKVV